MMSIEELYEFDLRGYIIYRQVLSPDDVKRIRTIINNVRGARGDGKFSFFDLDPYFMELMAHSHTIGVLKSLIGEWLRFDHAFGLDMSNHSIINNNLHGGPLQNQRAFSYQWVSGQGMHNGLIKVIYALNDVNSGDGGFICVPGSHKGNLYHRPKYDSHLVVNPELKSGDVLIFTEALVHGSRQWTADHRRMALIYSYSPGYMAWKHYDSVKPYLSLATTDLQRELLRPPYVGNYDEKLAEAAGVWPKDRRTPISYSQSGTATSRQLSFK